MAYDVSTVSSLYSASDDAFRAGKLIALSVVPLDCGKVVRLRTRHMRVYTRVSTLRMGVPMAEKTARLFNNGGS